MKCYDIIVTEFDDSGKMEHPENGVCASSREELVALYRACGSEIRIVREYDPPDAPLEAGQSGTIQMPSGEVVRAPGTVHEPKRSKAPPPVQKPAPAHAPAPMPSTPPAPAPVQRRQPPRFFTVAGIECKLDNGKVYQKQWVRLLGQEASNYRIVSDKNNKEFQLTGKHLEMLKWVLVEDENQGELNSSILNIING